MKRGMDISITASSHLQREVLHNTASSTRYIKCWKNYFLLFDAWMPLKLRIKSRGEHVNS